jgi:processive 1,2-diacylglycerol beta-glucosyltransferase
MKTYLTTKGVCKDRIFQSGIPIHPSFISNKFTTKITSRQNISVLLTGGSLGVGSILKLVRTLKNQGTLHYHVLCGKNMKLFEHLTTLKHPRITPFPYISSREELNRIYCIVDVVLTKPGGVTVSECLHKGLPIIVYDHLPGQEKINVEALLESELIYLLNIDKTSNWEDEVINIVTSHSLNEKINDYHKSLCLTNPADYILNSYIFK